MDEKERKEAVRALRIPRDPELYETPGSSRRARAVWAVAGLAALILIILRFRASLPIAVEVTVVSTLSPSQADAVLTASGYVVAQRKAAVASKGTGRLVALYVEEGDSVRAGQIIARLEHDDVEAKLAEARANLELAKAALAQAEAERYEAELTYGRLGRLVGDTTIPKAEFDASDARYRRASAAVRSAGAGIKVAEAGIRMAEVEVENTRIRAPFHGTVLTKDADVGEIVAPFASSLNARGAVVTVADMSSLMVEADVSESSIGKISPGMPCEVVLDALPDSRYRAVVHKVVPTVDRAKATVLTRVRFIDWDSRVLPDMSAKVTFQKGHSPGGDAARPYVVVNPAAVVDRGGRKVAFVLKEGKVAQVSVRPEGLAGDQLKVAEGLQPGDRVVLNPPERLRHGARVRIKD